MKIKGKQIAAILGIVALVGLYIATFIFAIIDSPNSGRMFQASLFATIAIPILLWIYLWCIQKFMERKKNQQDNVDEN